MPLSSHRELVVWQKSIDLIEEIYDVTASFPADERFGLTSQMRRSGVSIACNIAEGYGRRTRGEYLNGLSNANGSVGELDTLCVVAARVKVVSAAALARSEASLQEIAKMLNRLQYKLRTK
jgi:four helix bundle protein